MSKLTTAAVAAPRGISYPCLMRGKATGSIYLMMNAEEGTMVQPVIGSMIHKVKDFQSLAPFYGVVTLTQE